jgi:hypothetical protein
MVSRFKDDGQAIYDFGGRFLVRCPRCDKRAEVVSVKANDSATSIIRRLVCNRCGYTKDYDAKADYIGNNDWYFRLPLWLEMPCCGESLWAYNEVHLNFLENFVRAEIRETGLKTRQVENPYSYVNKTLASRLPQWIKSAKNRAEILRCIEKLRKTLE